MHSASKHTDESIDRSEQSSERRCIVRGESGPTDLLIRFAIAPDGTIVPDVAEKLPGRGVWVSAGAATITEAINKKMFGRAAKQPVTVPADLLAQTTVLLRQRVLSLLGLAKKSGDLSIGADAVEQQGKAGRLLAVVAAADASASGIADIAQHSRTDVAVMPLTAAELGAALGRDNTVYIGLPANRQGNTLQRDCKRLQHLLKDTE
jgi:predicted RNA-binding protein YlxR (DUF448 family)